MCFSLIQLNDLAVLDLNCESSLHCPLTYSLMFMQCSLKASESLGMVHLSGRGRWWKFPTPTYIVRIKRKNLLQRLMRD